MYKFVRLCKVNLFTISLNSAKNLILSEAVDAQSKNPSVLEVNENLKLCQN
jgi:hypothetical protein